MERWTEDFRIVCPEISDEGVNLQKRMISKIGQMEPTVYFLNIVI